jgi:hypothetical protein
MSVTLASYTVIIGVSSAALSVGIIAAATRTAATAMAEPVLPPHGYGFISSVAAVG